MIGVAFQIIEPVDGAFEDTFNNPINYEDGDNHKEHITCRNLPHSIYRFIGHVHVLEKQTRWEVMRHATMRGVDKMIKEHPKLMEFVNSYDTIIGGEYNHKLFKKLDRLRSIDFGGFAHPTAKTRTNITIILRTSENLGSICETIGFDKSYLAAISLVLAFMDSKHLDIEYRELFHDELDEFNDNIDEAEIRLRL